jgi:hypothetical protein
LNYQKIYDSIINNAKLSFRKKGNGIYYEEHHIIPVCMGGINNKSNKVLLTAREHFICHKLLFRIYPNNKKIGLAYHNMVYTMSDRRKLKLSSSDYEEARLIAFNASKGENNAMFGKKHSNEARKKQSEKAILRFSNPENILRGRITSEETKNKQREYALNRSPETLKKMSDAKLGQKLSPERIEALIKSRKGKPDFKLRKPISAVNPNGELIIFSGAIEMKEKFGLNVTCIFECLRGTQKTTNKWSNFKYI